MKIENCSVCGGTHYGSYKCPYIVAPCAECGCDTIMACSDCGIDFGGKVSIHVCEKRNCRDDHERKHQAWTQFGAQK
jgi:hypothetical protein